MILNEKTKNFLINSALTCGNTLIITDLEKIIFVSSSSFDQFINQPISNILKQILNHKTDLKIYCNSILFRYDSLPLSYNKTDNLNYSSQIIIPLFKEESIVGSVIMVSFHKTFNNSNFEYLKTTAEFIQKMLD